jgi:hypothetical protein
VGDRNGLAVVYFVGTRAFSSSNRERDLNLTSRQRAGRRVLSGNDGEESRAAERDVVLFRSNPGPRSTNGLGTGTGWPKVNVGHVGWKSVVFEIGYVASSLPDHASTIDSQAGGLVISAGSSATR